ncbi:MAG: glucose-6-phosphate isomerase [Hydrocarboniphaga sp.]|uniref:glucose-6-phosphate isomerase n=1 Tax=Hydrocarboniphaga sp. TaxID=2033016 RepID=UPI00261E37E5|nr:glucose-6-phosphate isomerase [Hydrocarboniphaga sp.]MDB5968907.1 glucose-6-phosphate isomerase [Hydrocarboniphaga sp.]
MSLTQTSAWQNLAALAVAFRKKTLVELFDADPGRATRFAAEACGVYLDYSKQRIDAEVLAALQRLAQQQDLSGRVAAMMSGERINPTEHRAVLHTALRAPKGYGKVVVDGQDVNVNVHRVLDRMAEFASRVRDGRHRSATGELFSHVVNIGIGGSDLGPRMVNEALIDFCDGPRTHYVANVDGAQLAAVLADLEPASTLFIVTSKTFTTLETMANAGAARRWLVRALGESAVSQHFIAVSTNAAEVRRFGIDPARMFEFWDWVGGRYSVWSAVGLSLMLALGPQRFREWLDGAHAMDRHFCETVPASNLPVLMALLAVWNRNFLDSPTQVVAPYAQNLEHFVHWLQQLEMESNGKRVHRDGSPLAVSTTPALWGDVGTNGQHAFFQMLHQGSDVHPVDFILPVRATHPWPEQQQMLIANCLAQSAALMRGKSADEVRAELSVKLSGSELEQAIPHRVFPGNRPSSTLLVQRLDPYHLGALMALYEHRTFVLSLLWDINAFDQWGVELGKSLAQTVLKAMNGEEVLLDASTRELLNKSLTY